jgi:hypothetical protein
MSSPLVVTILTPDPLDASGGRLVLDAFAHDAPEWSPVRWGQIEPDRPWAPGDEVQAWSPPTGEGADRYVTWRGSGPGRPTTSIKRRTPRELHSYLAVEVAPADVEQSHAVALIRSLSSQLTVDYGAIHVPGPLDLIRPLNPAISLTGNGSDTGDESSTLTVHVNQLRCYLPDLWWGNIFGPALVELVGRDRLAHAPAEISVPLTDDTWYLQVSAGVHDSITDPDGFETARARIKAHLGRDLWWDRNHPEASQRYWKAGERPGPPRYRAATFPQPEMERGGRRAG